MKTFKVSAKINFPTFFYIEKNSEEEVQNIANLYYLNELKNFKKNISINIEEIKSLEEFFI